MKNKGYTLIEILLITLVLIIIFLLAIPIVLKIIDSSNLGGFKSSVSNVFDAVDLYVANNKFVDISVSGIQIENNSSLKIKNNNFDKGLMIRNSEGKLELLYLVEGDFCAKGTKENLRVSDSGCGKLDETAPNSVAVLEFNKTNNSITIFAKVDEPDSKIMTYYYSIDNNKYIKTNNNKYTFDNIEGEHTFKIKVENEAGLIKESDEVKITTLNQSNIICNVNGEKIDSKKILNCTFPIGEGYIYEYKIDNNYEENQGTTFTKTFESNSKIDLRVRKENQIITSLTVDIKNIDNVIASSYPELLDNMIPVVYDSKSNTYIKADKDTIYWDYQNKIWANAVIVRKYKDSNDELSKSREYYLSDEAVGHTIYEKDIVGYFVWIPRFKYKLFNVLGTNSNKEVIDIIFENKNDIVSKAKGLYQNGDYITHPAFTFDNQELSGFWVSKYPASFDINSTCYKEPTINNCNRSDDINLYFLPNRKPITNISISNAFSLALNLKNSPLYLTNGDSHMMKNTEWGAVTYLASSIYGTNIEPNTSSLTSNNALNSTTGNMTGIFDMSGLMYEMVMGNYNKDAGLDENTNSGFEPYGINQFPNEQYYDLYTSITEKGMILGDATSEVKGWNGGSSTFINGSNPFFIRGGKNNLYANIYSYDSYSGNAREDVTFRIVLMNI